MARRAGVSINTTTYGNFRGVDFSTDSSLVDHYRSPWAVNMIADTGGMPEKRMGWRSLCQVEAPVNGLFCAVIGGVSHFLAHGGTKIYRWNEQGEPVVLKSGVHSGPSVAVNMGGKLWILTGGEYLVYDGERVRDVSEIAYVPTTVIGAAPAGGGQSFESINLLQAKRKNEFIPDGTSTVYQLDSTNIDAATVTATVRGVDKTEGTDFTVDRAKGTVTFKTAPEKPLVGQEGEVIITFAKTVAGYVQRVGKCTINFIAQTAGDIVSFVKRALGKKGGPERLYMGSIPDSTAQFIKQETGVDVTGYQAILPGSSIQHIFNNHGSEQTEVLRGQRAVLPEDIALLPQLLSSPDSVQLLDSTDADGRRIILFSKQIGDTYVTAQGVTDGRYALTTDTFWIKKGKPTDTTHNAGINTSPVENAQGAPPSGFPSFFTLSQGGEGVKEKYLSQSDGSDFGYADALALLNEEAATTGLEGQKTNQQYDDLYRQLYSQMQMMGYNDGMAESLDPDLQVSYADAMRQAEELAKIAEQSSSPTAGQEPTLQSRPEGRTMRAKGKYWRPNLSKAEWSLLNRKMDQGLGADDYFIDDATKWLFATEKGVSVFALYGIGDGTEATLLWAVGGKQAILYGARLKKYLEEENDAAKSRREAVNRFFKHIEN